MTAPAQTMDIWQRTDKEIRDANVPFSMILELTRRCNLSCVHCYNVKDERELSRESIRDIARQLREAGTMTLTLTGGEVFTRKDLPEILRALRKDGFDLRIITNGTLIGPEEEELLAEVYPSEIGISVYGATADTHEKITRSIGSFHKTIGAIRALRNKGLPVHIKCTLMKENIHERKDLISLAEELGVTYIMDPVVSPRDDGDDTPLEHRLPEEEIVPLLEEEMARTIDLEENTGPVPCDAGRNFGSISALGDVYPCIQFPLSVGNVLKKDLAEIWASSETLKKLRTQCEMSGDCAHCADKEYCNKCPGLSYLERGDAFGPCSASCMSAETYHRLIEQRKEKS